MYVVYLFTSHVNQAHARRHESFPLFLQFLLAWTSFLHVVQRMRFRPRDETWDYHGCTLEVMAERCSATKCSRSMNFAAVFTLVGAMSKPLLLGLGLAAVLPECFDCAGSMFAWSCDGAWVLRDAWCLMSPCWGFLSFWILFVLSFFGRRSSSSSSGSYPNISIIRWRCNLSSFSRACDFSSKQNCHTNEMMKACCKNRKKENWHMTPARRCHLPRHRFDSAAAASCYPLSFCPLGAGFEVWVPVWILSGATVCYPTRGAGISWAVSSRELFGIVVSVPESCAAVDVADMEIWQDGSGQAIWRNGLWLGKYHRPKILLHHSGARFVSIKARSFWLVIAVWGLCHGPRLLWISTAPSSGSVRSDDRLCDMVVWIPHALACEFQCLKCQGLWHQKREEHEQDVVPRGKGGVEAQGSGIKKEEDRNYADGLPRGMDHCEFLFVV